MLNGGSFAISLCYRSVRAILCTACGAGTDVSGRGMGRYDPGVVFRVANPVGEPDMKWLRNRPVCAAIFVTPLIAGTVPAAGPTTHLATTRAAATRPALAHPPATRAVAADPRPAIQKLNAKDGTDADRLAAVRQLQSIGPTGRAATPTLVKVLKRIDPLPSGGLL